MIPMWPSNNLIHERFERRHSVVVAAAAGIEMAGDDFGIDVAAIVFGPVNSTVPDYLYSYSYSYSYPCLLLP